MFKYEKFATKYEGEPKYYVAARHLGLQDCQDNESEQKIWVHNNSLHFTEDVVDHEQCPYIWLADFARGRPALNHQIPNNTFAATVAGTLSKKKVLLRESKQLKLQVDISGSFA